MTSERTGLTDDLEVQAEVIEIEADLETTRTEMSGTLEEIGERLDPAHLADQAKDKVKEATVGRVEEAIETAGETAKGVSEMVIETIRRNPIPAAMAGVGLMMLWQNRQDGQVPYGNRSERLVQDAKRGAAQLGENVGDAADSAVRTAQDMAANVATTAQQNAGQIGASLRRVAYDSPLVVGIAALGAGAAVGALVPDTSLERDLVGEPSSNLVRAAGEAVSDIGRETSEAVSGSSV
ncbi:MAG TPA: DUF3618 domain-containing protein [Candidatus Limnocylindria bacterium]